MGNCLRIIFEKLRCRGRNKKSVVLLIVGLDNAGKTSVLNCICNNSSESVPTIGFHTVTMNHKSCNVRIYDLGGGSQIRPLWPKYYNDVHGVIYVVDASDIDRLSENRIIYEEFVSHEHISGKPVLFLANKQDLNGAMDELDIVECMNIEQLANRMRSPTRVEICSCSPAAAAKSAYNTLGIFDGYNWLLQTILDDYNELNKRTRSARQSANGRVRPKSFLRPLTFTKTSNPFKAIHEVIAEEGRKPSAIPNGIKKPPLHLLLKGNKNKTAPLPEKLEVNVIPPDQEENFKIFSPRHLPRADSFDGRNQKRNEVKASPASVFHYGSQSARSLRRPRTAPGATTDFQRPVLKSVLTIPGQL